MADFVDANLGYQKRGTVVEVHLSGSAANVMLVDSSNFAKYRNGQECGGVGGFYEETPIHFEIPRAGTWHVVADIGGYEGRLGMQAYTFPPPGRLPQIRQRPTGAGLASIAENAAAFIPPADVEDAVEGELPEYDVFICHAGEDKDAFVRPLAHALQQRGLEVWYDEFTLRIGDNLRRKIDAGLVRSRFGVVVLSRHFFERGWSQYELDGLVTREAVHNAQVILPIWHEISKDDVMKQSPSLVAKKALQTSEFSVDEIAEQIAEVVSMPVG